MGYNRQKNDEKKNHSISSNDGVFCYFSNGPKQQQCVNIPSNNHTNTKTFL